MSTYWHTLLPHYALQILAASGGPRRRARQRFPTAPQPGRARQPSGAGGDPEAVPHRGRTAGDAVGKPHRAGAGRRSGRLPGGDRPPAGAVRNLFAAYQLPDGALRHRAAAPDPDVVARLRRHGPPGLGVDLRLAGHEAKPPRLAYLFARAANGRVSPAPITSNLTAEPRPL